MLLVFGLVLILNEVQTWHLRRRRIEFAAALAGYEAMLAGTAD